MREVIPFLSHTPPPLYGDFTKNHGIYLHRAACAVVKHAEAMEEYDKRGTYNQIDRLIITACALLIADGLVRAAETTEDPVVAVEYARGLVKVAYETAEAGTSALEMFTAMYPSWNKKKCADVLRACLTLHTYFSDDNNTEEE